MTTLLRASIFQAKARIELDLERSLMHENFTKLKPWFNSAFTLLGLMINVLNLD